MKDLGIGVGLRPPHLSEFLNHPPSSVSWVEVISENYMSWEDRILPGPHKTLEKIRSHLPIALHGVSLSIGSVDPVNRSYLQRLKNLIERIEPAVVSDHLCFTGVNGENTHDLLPMPYTEEAIGLVTRKISEVQEFLGRQILIENVSSYLSYEHSEMTEWEFLNEILRRADCGLLLDINNIYVSSVNHSFDPLTYLKAIPVNRVGQIHLAGHTNKKGYLIDTHDAPVCQEVWDLYQWSVQNLGRFSTMIERDANIPVWEELEAELKMIAQIRKGKEVKRGTREVSATV